MLLENGYRTQDFNAGNPWVSRYYGYDRGFSQLVDFLDLQPDSNPGFKFVRKEKEPKIVSVGKPSYFRTFPFQSMARSCMPQTVRRFARKLIQELKDRLCYTDHIKIKLDIERQFTPRVIQWIMGNDREPFFLWIHFMTVHEPYAPPLIDQLKVNHTVLWRNSVNRLRREAEHRLKNDVVTRTYLDRFSSLYDAEIRRVDRHVGKILKALHRKGMYDRSCIILCSDHGEEFFEHGGLFHRSKLYDELLRVPLLIHLPGQKSCQIVSGRVGLIDLLPTIADYLGIKIDLGNCEGESIGGMLTGTPSHGEERRVLAAETFYDSSETIFELNPYDTCGAARRMCLHNGKLKLIVDYCQKTLAIYDVERDPSERNDLSKTHPRLKKIAEPIVREYLRNSEKRRIVLSMRKHSHRRPEGYL
jgi:arylsulfatase A-like enzyme